MKDDTTLLSELKAGSEAAFTQLFEKYYKDLVMFGGHFLNDKESCEDIVQTIFLKIWADKEEIEITTSFKSFLLQSVKNRCLDSIRHQQIIRQHESHSEKFGLFFDNLDTENYVLHSDLVQNMEAALNKLSPNQQSAFRMNRFEGLRYKDIAIKLSISEREVVALISKTLRMLRQDLKDFLITIAMLLFVKFL